MRLSIITINYNGSESTINLLKSLNEQTDKDFGVVVIDNASKGADFNNLEKYCNTYSDPTRTVLVKLGENLGFSGGNNVGIKKSLEIGSDWIFLLNSDTWIKEGFVEGLKAVLGPKTGVIGIALSEDSQIAYCGKVLWLKSHGHHIYDKKKAESTSAKYVIGGAMAISRDVFEKIGLLDENYFLYFEDADYTVRARKAGIPISIMPNIMIYHNVSSSTKKLGSPLLLRYHYRNAVYFNWKNGPWYIKILVWPWSFWIMKKQLFKIMFMYQQEISLAILLGVIDFYKGRMGKIV